MFGSIPAENVINGVIEELRCGEQLHFSVRWESHVSPDWDPAKKPKAVVSMFYSLVHVVRVGDTRWAVTLGREGSNSRFAAKNLMILKLFDVDAKKQEHYSLSANLAFMRECDSLFSRSAILLLEDGRLALHRNSLFAHAMWSNFGLNQNDWIELERRKVKIIEPDMKFLIRDQTPYRMKYARETISFIFDAIWKTMEANSRVR